MTKRIQPPTGIERVGSIDAMRARAIHPKTLDRGTQCRVASAEGRDGVVRFVLRRVGRGLYVEREEAPRKGPHTSISVEFAEREGFGQWLNEDPCRFDSPLLHQRLRKDADELWGSEE